MEQISSKSNRGKQLRQRFLSTIWRQFERLNLTDKECLDRLLLHINPDSLQFCTYCDSYKISRTKNERVVFCKDCKRSKWLTAGTFFNRVKNVRAWYAAIWFLGRGILLSSSEFHKLLNIALSTAQDIHRKLLRVIESEMLVCNTSYVHSGELLSVVCKRSSNTPGLRHPIAEQEEIEAAISQSQSTTTSSSLSSQEDANSSTELMPDNSKLILDSFGSVPITIDEICTKTNLSSSEVSSATSILTILGYVSSLPGNAFVLRDSKNVGDEAVPTELETGVKVALELAIDFIKETYHGVSRKYLQLYLAAFWCFKDRSKWDEVNLLRSCNQFMRSGQMKEDRIFRSRVRYKKNKNSSSENVYSKLDLPIMLKILPQF